MRLDLLQTQKLNLSMQHSLKFLQLNNIQLERHINELLNSNPMLERDESKMSAMPAPVTPFSTHVKTDFSDYDKNTILEQKSAEASPLEDIFLQLMALDLPRKDSDILKFLILSLDCNGFLKESPAEISRSLSVDVRDVEAAISRLQAMDPAGIGAKDIAECLILQLTRRYPDDDLNHTAIEIIRSYFDMFAREKYAFIAKRLGVPAKTIHSAAKRIRKLSPKPLNGCGNDKDPVYITPDFYVVEDGGSFKYLLNEYYLPKIKICTDYVQLMDSGLLSGTDLKFCQTNYAQAKDVLRFISYRESTLQRVVEYVIDCQEDFFRYGPGHRVSMTNYELAEALQLHDSTISRAVSNKYFECKWGVFPLKYLFNRGVKTESISNVNYDAVAILIKKIIAGEPSGQ